MHRIGIPFLVIGVLLLGGGGLGFFVASKIQGRIFCELEASRATAGIAQTLGYMKRLREGKAETVIESMDMELDENIITADAMLDKLTESTRSNTLKWLSKTALYRKEFPSKTDSPELEAYVSNALNRAENLQKK